MQRNNMEFSPTDWNDIQPHKHLGESGFALWRTQQFANVRVRIVEYSCGYISDHWCNKGHILLCLEGEFLVELDDGRSFTLSAGMCYQVVDQTESHRASSRLGAKLFIVD